MSLFNAAAAFSRLYPVHPDTQPNAGWDMNCALLMARFGLARGGVGWAVAPRAYGDAITVANNSGPLNKNAAAAPVGAWHYWNWAVFGHVGSDLTGGGNDVFMASAFLRDEWGTHLGLNSVGGYNAANRSATYLGWATNYRGGRYNLPAGTASSGSKPLDNTTAPALKPKENEMRLISNAKTGEIVWTDFVEHWIPTGTAFQVYSYGRATNQLPEYQPFLDSVNDAGAANTIIHNMVATSGGQLSDDAFNIVKTTYLNLNPGKK